MYKMSNLKFCDAGEDLIDGECKQLSCSIYYENQEEGVSEANWGSLQYPIHQADGKGPRVGSKKTPGYKKPVNLEVGECQKYLTEKYYEEKVESGSTCVLQCAYNQNEAEGVYNTFQPEDPSDEAMVSTCTSARWSDNAAKNCVEVGIIAEIVGSDAEL